MHTETKCVQLVMSFAVQKTMLDYVIPFVQHLLVRRVYLRSLDSCFETSIF